MSSERRVASLVILGLVAFFFGLAIVGDRGLYTGDLWTFTGARDRLLDQALREEHTIPRWVPGCYGGVPGLASQEFGFLYPPNVVLAFVAGDRAEALGLALHFALGAFGALALVRKLGGSERAGLVAAVAFMFGGAVVSAYITPLLVAGAAWTTWFASAAIGLGRGEPRALAVATLSLLAIYLVGDPGGCIIALLVAALVATARTRIDAVRSIPWVALAVGFAALLGAAQLFPAAAVADETARWRGLTYDAATRWSFWPPEALGFLVPFTFGDHFHPGSVWIDAVYPDHERAWAETYYVGPIVLALATAGLARVRESALTRAGLALVLVFAIPALGKFTPLYALLYKIPGAHSFRYPAKLMVFAALGVALLAGAGFDDLQRRRRLVLGALTSFALAALGGLVHVLSDHASLAAAIDAQGLARIHGADAVDALGPRLVHVLVVAAGALAILARPSKRAPTAIATLVIIDLALALGPGICLAAREPFDRAPRTAGLLEDATRADGCPARVLGFPSARAIAPEDERAVAYPATEHLARLEGLDPNSGLGRNVLLQGGFLANPPFRAAYLDVRLEKLRKTNPIDAAIRSGARYVVVGAGEDKGADATVAGTLDSRVLLRLERAPPWAGVYGAVAYVASRTEAGKAVAAPSFDPRDHVVLETSAEDVDPHAQGTARLASPFGLHGFELDVESSGPAWLVVREAWARGWSATVNDEPASVVPADVLFRAVRIPRGKSHVIFRFEAPGAFAGAVVSAVTAAVLGLLWALTALRRSVPAPSA